MSIKLDYEKDNTIDTTDLEKEFKRLPSLIFGWSETRAEAEETFGLAKAAYEELRSAKYLEIKSKEGKVTEANVEAQIDTDKEVKEALRTMLSSKRDYETIRGYVDSMHAKKDCLIQIGATARKEM